MDFKTFDVYLCTIMHKDTKMKREKIRVKIPIHDEVYLRMKVLYMHGDFTQIAYSSGFKVYLVQKVWREKEGRKEVVDAITKFYEKREALLQSPSLKLNTVAQ